MRGHQELNDIELIELMAQDKQWAFSELYNRYWKKVLAVTIHKINDISEAESIVQEIFYSLWQRRADLKISTNFNNYLMASVKYQVIKLLNKQRQQRLFEMEAIPNIDLLDDSTQKYLDLTELTQRLEKLVCALPETCQLIYRMNKEEEKSYRKIADEMGISEKAVDAHLVRAKKILRAGLGSYLSSFLL